jgi:hypothetical protein
LRQIKAFDGFSQRYFFAVLLGRPAEEADVIHDGFGQKTTCRIAGERSALVPLAHLGTVFVQDERNVRVMRRRHAKRLEQGDVLGGVAEMVLAADDVGDVHFQIVNDIDEVKHRLAVGAHDDEVGIGLFAVGQVAADFADDGRG